MSPRIRQFIGLQTGLFLQRRFHAFAATHVFPLVIHINDELAHYPTAEDYIPAVSSFRDLLDRHDVRQVVPGIEAVELPRNGRFRIWVNWQFLREGGALHDVSRGVIFLRSLEGRLQVEMSDYERHVAGAIPVPERKHRLA